MSCSSDEKTQSLSEIPDPQHKAEIQLDKNDYIISVVAKNSAGSSPPSTIASMEIPNGEWLRWHAAGERGFRGKRSEGVACSPVPQLPSRTARCCCFCCCCRRRHLRKNGRVNISCSLRQWPLVLSGSICPGGRGSHCPQSL